MKSSVDHSDTPADDLKPGDRVSFVDPFFEVVSYGIIVARGHPFLGGDKNFIVAHDAGNPRHLPPERLTRVEPGGTSYTINSGKPDDTFQ